MNQKKLNQKRKNNYCIYLHKIPGTQSVFYVGQANNKYRPNSKYYRNKHWHNTVKKYGGFEVELLYRNLTKEEADNLEILLIKKLGRADLNEGLLVNMTNGGEGNVGLIFSDEHRSKISSASIRNQNWKYLKDYNSKRSSGEIKCSEEQRKKLSEARRKRVCTDETRKKMSNTRKAFYSGRDIPGKAVLQFSKDGILISEFISLSKAAEIVTGKKKYASNIMDCCKGKKKTAYGFVWKYKI